MTVVSDYSDWAHRLARSLIGEDLRTEWAMDYQDLAQIGMIAMWEAEKTYDPSKGSLPAWLTLKGRGAIKDAIRSRNKHEALKFAERDEEVLAQIAQEDAAFDHVLEAYHQGEIQEAIASLSPRQQEYVRMRFWHGLNSRELAEHFGYDPSALWNSRRNGARQKLAQRLEHLQ